MLRKRSMSKIFAKFISFILCNSYIFLSVKNKKRACKSFLEVTYNQEIEKITNFTRVDKDILVNHTKNTRE